VSGRPGAADLPAAGGAVTITCGSPEATQALAAAIGRRAEPGTVIALSGDLGAGKTCFIQGLASGLGVATYVTSPTFVMIAEHAGRLPLYHVDLYRTESLAEIRALGLDELLDGEGVTAIEWAEKADALLPDRMVRVRIRGAGAEPRAVEIEGAPADWLTPAS
jgi:tRNA threonylcarbamoyladenosine biosynthesis protein TsaE